MQPDMEMMGKMVLAEINKTNLISLAEYGWVVRKRPDLLEVLAKYYDSDIIDAKSAFKEIEKILMEKP